MDKNEYEDKKSRIKNNETAILNAIIDMNYADNSQIHDIKAKLYQIEADCMAIGEYYEQAGLEEENKRKYSKVLEAQEIAIKQNVENDNKRTAVAEESLKIQNASFELQSNILKTQEADKADTAKHNETFEKQNQKLITICESIAYSLAKLAINSDNFDKNFKYMTPQKLDEFDIKKDIGDTEYRDKIGD